jgi:hypothetical protein
MYSLIAGPLSVEALTIPIQGLSKSQQGTKLVQLSDLHFDGLRLSEQLLQQAIDITNEVEPDLILLTGDYVTDDPNPIYELARLLKTLQSRAGIYAVLGNHDRYYPESQAKITTALIQVGIQVLWDQVAYPLGEELALIGLRDYWARPFNPGPVMAQVPPETPRIVLSHNPDSAKILKQWRVDLQLSGHTHGGQVVIPGIGPVALGIKKLRRRVPKSLQRCLPSWAIKYDKTVQHWEWAQGLHEVGNNLLYVNRGLGTYLPGRLFCPPEVTVITLTCKNSRD